MENKEILNNYIIVKPDNQTAEFNLFVPEDTRIEVENTIKVWSLKRGYHKPIAIFPITYAVTYIIDYYEQDKQNQAPST